MRARPQFTWDAPAGWQVKGWRYLVSSRSKIQHRTYRRGVSSNFHDLPKQGDSRIAGECANRVITPSSFPFARHRATLKRAIFVMGPL
jgi:hypothetical protein